MNKFLAFLHVHRQDIAFTLLVTLASGVLFFIPTGFTSPYPEGSFLWAKARILSTDNSTVKTIGPSKHGSQQLELEILNTRFKGQHYSATNNLLGKKELDKWFSPGDTAFVILDLTPDRTEIAHINVMDHFRLEGIAVLFLLFIIVLLGFAGWIGFKAFISFVFSVALILKMLLPLMLYGWDPLLLTFLVVTILTFVIIFLVGGFTKKGLVSFIGSMGGVALTTVLAYLFTSWFKIHGAVRPFAENLLYMGFDWISLPRLFTAGVFLASSGAVMDLSMDISAAMAEIVHKHPRISRGELIKSGFTVGRHVVGTMTTTLLLAYTGGYTALMMTFIAQGIPLPNIINMIYVAAEIIHTMVGSFGLVMVAPITAIAGGLVYVGGDPKAN
ncbi:MAG: YibE/F family protein [Treponemataceae bacterium]|nr:YibE/F family protein [Treponemataceae bacterium]